MKICKKCEADLDATEGQHFGSCPDHPNNIAKLNRLTQREESTTGGLIPVDSQTQIVLQGPKFVLPEATMILPQETIQKAMEVFFKQAMGLDVEVTAFDINEPVATARQAFSVTFKGKS